ncbi:hypothetical protein ACNKHR_25160 [Shigella flexneri]
MLVVIKAVFVIFAARQKNKRLGIGHFRVPAGELHWWWRWPNE